MGTLKTSEISPDIVDFLEEKSVSPEQFRNLWQVSEWENKLTLKKSNCDVREFIEMICSNYKLSVVKDLSIDTDRFHIFCLYSRFILGKDLLLNISIEKDVDKLVAHVKLRSQNMGVVVMIGKKIKKMGE